MATLEAEVFLLGIWKDFDDLESSLSMPELSAILVSSREREERQQRFMAALQGVDLDEENSTSSGNSKEFEDLKARVFSGGYASDANDIMSMQGLNAQQAGWGIGNGIDFEIAGPDFTW